jgi:hypothetical protein
MAIAVIAAMNLDFFAILQKNITKKESYLAKTS